MTHGIPNASEELYVMKHCHVMEVISALIGVIYAMGINSVLVVLTRKTGISWNSTNVRTMSFDAQMVCAFQKNSGWMVSFSSDAE